MPSSEPIPTPSTTNGTTERRFPIDGGHQLSAAIHANNGSVRITLECDEPKPLTLHWGVAWQFRDQWQVPPEDDRPAGTSIVEPGAARTPFVQAEGRQKLDLEFHKTAEGKGPRGFRCVLFRPEDGAWLKSSGQDVYLPLFESSPDPRLGSSLVRDLAEEIITPERNAGSWTLMHRFNLCHDLIDRAENEEGALALLFAWLRYSANRHLDWQRRFNTKPRELAHAQDRLTRRLARLWRKGGAGREWSRRMLTTLGRGGDGQRVRDEILHIMHRNHIKETHGHFMEEWHQKLHNNTTPDDVAICAAYVEFLKTNGKVDVFYKVLQDNGVTRERLKSFERPIKTDPDFRGEMKDALIGEFTNFLGILKSVHSGTDLETSVNAARGRLGGKVAEKVDAVLTARRKSGDVVNAIVEARAALAPALGGAGDDGALRDFLFLDLSLEESLRGAIEKQELSKLDRERLAALTASVLGSLTVATDEAELKLVAAHWRTVLSLPRDGREWALHARSVTDRAGRWLQGSTDALYRALQPKADYLGEAFGVAKWAVSLFSEEVVRGGPTFPLSLLLRHLDPLLRKEAGLGGWQIISPATAVGRLRPVESLLAVQAENFPEPTVLVADHVGGNEEIPAGVTAVLTLDAPDLVSHVAVRARNAGVLFATCFDPDRYAQLKALGDKVVSLNVTPGGDVESREGTLAEVRHGEAIRSKAPAHRVSIDATAWAIGQDQFTPAVVGGKSNNLNGLRGRLPNWIQLPTAFALPYGACERALRDPVNAETQQRLRELVATAGAEPAVPLAQVRELIRGLREPAGLRDEVSAVWQRSGLSMVSWDAAWSAIRRVWASKWNDRASLSRRARGTPDNDLVMAVLVQQVVEADYAFVIHTTNPLTGNAGELYAEVVLGMGETLVGNYPGRALGFVFRKGDNGLEILSYPGKSEGLYGRGVIFRSDSNGEDLEGFAGAGLYDSFVAEEPEHRRLDYTGERLVRDRGFRDDLLRAVARIGLEVEKVLGSAQDIEGAVAGGKYFVVQTRPQVGLRQDK